jgi:ADP-heptose:LPS heptosyltransferase
VAPTAVVLRDLGLGDLLVAVPALRLLRRALPDHRVVLLGPGWVGDVAGFPVDAVADDATAGPPDVVVNLHGRGPQSHALLRAARPRRLIAFGEPPDAVWRAGEHEVARWCRLLAESGIAADPADLRIAPPRTPAPAVAHGATLIHPGAASGARRWPAERWAAVARAERAAGRPVAVTGSAGERALAAAVAEAAGLPASAVLAGRTDLEGLAACVAAAARVACGDTGVAHLATALGTPSVVLFGPTPPSEWGPPPDPRHAVLWAGRRGDPHAAEPDPGLLAIAAEDVVGAVRDLPARRFAA